MPTLPHSHETLQAPMTTLPADALEPWPDNDLEEPGRARCPTCHRPLFPPQASAVLDVLLAADEALRTAASCVSTLKALVETAVP